MILKNPPLNVTIRLTYPQRLVYYCRAVRQARSSGALNHDMFPPIAWLAPPRSGHALAIPRIRAPSHYDADWMTI